MLFLPATDERGMKLVFPGCLGKRFTSGDLGQDLELELRGELATVFQSY
jgi:hypothetical protein